MLDILRLGAAWVRVRLLGGKAPFFVGWNITFRCNLGCRYCASTQARGPELETGEVLAGLDMLWDMGARWVTFGGGEPLLREDLGEIIQHAKARGFRVFVSTNGTLLPRKIDVLRGVDHVTLSLDGPVAVHDAARGKGTYARTVAALNACKAADIPVSLQCVLSSLNLAHVTDVANIAAAHKTSVMFQPATKWLDSSTKPNPVAPETVPYRAAIDEIVELKQAGAPIRNSFSGLRHLAQWPDPAPIWCGAGSLMCEVEPDGSVVACHQAQVSLFLNHQCATGDMRTRFAGMVMPQNCVQCWCAPIVELALLFSLRKDAILNAWRMLKV